MITWIVNVEFEGTEKLSVFDIRDKLEKTLKIEYTGSGYCLSTGKYDVDFPTVSEQEAKKLKTKTMQRLKTLHIDGVTTIHCQE